MSDAQKADDGQDNPATVPGAPAASEARLNMPKAHRAKAKPAAEAPEVEPAPAGPGATLIDLQEVLYAGHVVARASSPDRKVRLVRHGEGSWSIAVAIVGPLCDLVDAGLLSAEDLTASDYIIVE